MDTNTHERQTKQQTLERDGYKCALCSKKGVQVHEIVPRSRFGKLQQELLFDIRNRICLCPDCHDKAHNISSRKQLLKFLQSKYNYQYPEYIFQRYLN